MDEEHGKGDGGEGDDEGGEDGVEIGRLRMETLLLESCHAPPHLNKSNRRTGQSKPVRQ